MLSQRPVLRQEQRLKMTPQLYQAIRIMALPLQDLQVTIQEELERNPALEVLEDNSTASLDAAPDGTEEESVFAESSDPGYLNGGGSGGSDDTKRMFLEGALSRPETLQEHLLWQLQLQPLTTQEFRLGELLVRNLDDNGFMLEAPEALDRAAPPERLRTLMELIQGFDPPGCCTRDFTDSLLAQIRVHPHPEPGSAELVRNYMELAERGKLGEIARAMAVSEREVRSILGFVRELDPIPGRNYGSEQVRYVSPDVTVRQIDGELRLMLNDEQIPVLGVNRFFEELSRDNPDRELKKFVNHNLQDARWFMRSIDERNRSLLKVTRAVVEVQHEFFRRGPKYLAPLTLKDVAAEVGVHEATVSRLANGKYVQTELGIFELRYFFTNSISGAGSKGSRYSKTGVKEMVREIVTDAGTTNGAAGKPLSDSHKPLSDSRIAEILAEKGVKIARRTVAKYRKELDIDSSYRRT
jgi:RNA polymerase sigma-54 factor